VGGMKGGAGSRKFSFHEPTGGGKMTPCESWEPNSFLNL
jgi:hypothetical protein